MKKLNRKKFSFTAELAKDDNLLFDVRMSLRLRIDDLESCVNDYKLAVEHYKKSGESSYVSEINTILDSYQARLDSLREFTDKLYLVF